MPGVSWQERDGRRWLLVDYSHAAEHEMLPIAEESVRELEAAPEGTLVVVDVTAAPVTRDWLYYVRRTNNTLMGPKRIRTAALGIHGVKAAMFRGFNAASNVKARPFRTLDEALTWLLDGR